MVHCVDETSIGWKDVEGMPNAEKNLVAGEVEGFWQVQWMMSFSNPDSVITNAFSFEAHYLK